MSDKSIYTQLVKAGLSSAGACGLMGNMQAESAMRADNAQDGMTRLSDADYTAGVDNGTYTNFVKDAVGYGLCQWTFYSRKQALLAFAKNRGVSIGNEAMQVDFCIKELKSDYPALWKYLCTTTDINTAASRVCTEYERPAVNNISVRAQAAQRFFSLYSKTEVKETKTSYWPPRVLDYGMSGLDVSVLQALLKVWGYSLDITGKYDNTTTAVVKDFQTTAGLAVDGVAGPKTFSALTKI